MPDRLQTFTLLLLLLLTTSHYPESGISLVNPRYFQRVRLLMGLTRVAVEDDACKTIHKTWLAAEGCCEAKQIEKANRLLLPRRDR